MRILLVLVFAVLVCGCTLLEPRNAPEPLFSATVRFEPPSPVFSEADPLALDVAMREFLAHVVKPALRDQTPQQALLQALASRTELKIEYDGVMTRNAAQTFDARAGNCLSLVLMTAALARELHLAVTYNLVSVDDIWIRRDGLQSAIGHVNLTLGKRRADLRDFNDPRNLTTVDFLPPKDLAHQRSQEISEARVLSMYFNNRAVERMTEGQLDDAYWFARAAIMRDPSFASARNTLGVVYLRHQDLQAAGDAFEDVLERDPQHVTALVNKIHLLDATGQQAAAATLTKVLRRLQPVQPFQFLDAGLDAMRLQDFAGARLLFEKELERDPHDAETQYWLATAHASLGETSRARDALRDAIDNSTSGARRDVYVAKLQRLKSGVAKDAGLLK